MLQYKANLSPFSPYALAAHPDHIDFLAAYQKFRVFIETWLTAAHSFQATEQRGSSTNELRRSFQAIGHAAKEASYARLCFCAVSPVGVGKLADQILNATMRSACKVVGRSVPTTFLDAGPISDDLPAMWADLHHEIHKVVNKPARKTLKVMPTPPILVDDLVDKNEVAGRCGVLPATPHLSGEEHSGAPEQARDGVRSGVPERAFGVGAALLDVVPESTGHPQRPGEVLKRPTRALSHNRPPRPTCADAP
ncbi:hypothetical protein ABR737_33455 [Streptomyces sp. Edi2]|uniref:hypothetical protein n=1 Tax=Streptomyces sp. Edi2 TaxID=3162528 RepID=UPI0033065C28